MKTYNVAVVGATGAVGEVILEILEERGFPVGKLYFVASSRSKGMELEFAGKQGVVEDIEEFDFSKVEIAFFSAGSKVSKEYATKAAETGCVVIDNTSCFRMDKDVPLVVPEVNPEAIADYTKSNIIANPNCSTIQMVVALKPIYDEVGIERVNVATYQSVSGTGKSAIEELMEQTTAIFNSQEIKAEVYPKPIAFNILPQIDSFDENGYTFEEMKIINETKKIFNDDSILVNATAARVPVIYGHSEAVHIETRDKISADYVRGILSNAPGIAVMDARFDGSYPTAFDDAMGNDEVYVGRIRDDLSHPRGINMWVVSDNIRKGAALNSIQIAEMLIEGYLA